MDNAGCRNGVRGLCCGRPQENQEGKQIVDDWVIPE